MARVAAVFCLCEEPVMRAFTVVTSKIAPLDRPNVDTDAIILKQYLKSIRRIGFGPFLFDDWRYLDAGDMGIDLATRRFNLHASERVRVGQARVRKCRTVGSP